MRLHCPVRKCSTEWVFWFGFLVGSGDVRVPHQRLRAIVSWPSCSLRLLLFIIHLLIQQIIRGGPPELAWKHYGFRCLLPKYVGLLWFVVAWCLASFLCFEPGVRFWGVMLYAELVPDVQSILNGGVGPEFLSFWSPALPWRRSVTLLVFREEHILVILDLALLYERVHLEYLIISICIYRGMDSFGITTFHLCSWPIESFSRPLAIKIHLAHSSQAW